MVSSLPSHETVVANNGYKLTCCLSKTSLLHALKIIHRQIRAHQETVNAHFETF